MILPLTEITANVPPDSRDVPPSSVLCKHDNFDKLSKDVEEASAACARTYAIWHADTERLRRLERLRHDAWMELVATVQDPRLEEGRR